MANESHCHYIFSLIFLNSILNFHFYGDNEATQKVRAYKILGAPWNDLTGYDFPSKSFETFLIKKNKNLEVAVVNRNGIS